VVGVVVVVVGVVVVVVGVVVRPQTEKNEKHTFEHNIRLWRM